MSPEWRCPKGVGGGGQGGRNAGVMGARSLWEAREDGVGGGPPKRAGAWGNGKNYATLAQYFAIGKAHRGGNRYGRGWEPGVQGAGSRKFRPPCSPPPHHHKGEFPLYPALCSLLRRHSFGSSRTPRDEPKECLRRRPSSVGLLIFWNWKTKYIKLMQENPWERNSISDETLQVCLHEWGVGA